MPGLRKVANVPAEFRAKVPSDIATRLKGRKVTIVFPAIGNVPAVQTSVTLGSHAKIALRTTDESIIVARTALAIAQLETLYGAVRRGPIELTQMQVAGVSRAAYDVFFALAGSNPGGEARWRDFIRWNAALREGRVWRGARVWPDALPEEIWPAERVDAVEGTWDVEEGLEARYGALADFALERAGLDIASGPRETLLREIDRACTQAAEQLLRNARGDWRPDPDANRFPVFEKEPSISLTLTALFDLWESRTKPSLLISTES